MRVVRVSSVFMLASTSMAYAHSAERGFVMLLPTGFIITAGALAVAVSFLVLSVMHDATLKRWMEHRLIILWKRCDCPFWTSLISAGLIALLLMRGLAGSADPLENLLPLAVWTGWWVIIVLLHPLLGNLWGGLNPLAWMQWKFNHDRYPKHWAYWPALFLFACFAWFQLVYPAPDHPQTLAMVMIVYLAVTACAALIFGPKPWFTFADPLAVMSRFLGWMAPLQRRGDTAYQVGWPALPLAKTETLPLSAALMIVLMLSTIAYDALASTFWWLALWGINPFEYPGRSAVMAQQTLGLIVSFCALAAAIVATVWAGLALSGMKQEMKNGFGFFALSLLPISIAFHASHYLTDLLVNGQYLLAALGLGDGHVTASFLNTANGAWTLFAIQTALIVLGHMASVLVAHLIVIRHGIMGRKALLFELPLALFMVAFTGFGLWLLATPTLT
jgi:hypothetical protein